jgi:hypothetical protein
MKRLLPFLCLFALVAFVGCDSNDDDDDNLDGPATITGQITDSQLGEAIADATVIFSRGQAERSTTTDADGEFTIENIATGTLLMTVRATGYLEFSEEIEVVDGVNEIPSIPVAVAPPAGAYRIVLSWGQQPSDLDSHLTGPDGNNGRFHVYFGNRSFGEVADLDRDDVTSFGPETITVNPETDGMYRYSVHNYSNQSTTGSQGIAGTIENSIPARVQVYSSQALVREYRAPAATDGNTWRVFEMNVSGSNVTFTDRNTYVTASSAGDAGTFRGVGAKLALPAAGF